MSENQKHILFIASWYPNRNASALGNFIQQHAHAAAITNKISVVFAASENDIPEEKIEIVENHNGNLSEYVLYFGKTKSFLPVIKQLKKRDAYKNAIQKGVDLAIKKNGAPDLIHVHVIYPAAIAVLPLLSKYKIPLLISEHWSGYLPEDGNYKGLIQKNISKHLAEKANHITVVSKRMEDAMKQHGLGTSFSLLPNAVDTNIFHNQHQTTDNKHFQLLHVSMLVDKEKNISGLLNVMKSISTKDEITLKIIGDGPERKKHEEHAKQLGILNKTVFFLGYKSPEEIATEMGKSAALIMFSNYEGMPVTIIEAQCCGLPVIATRTGSIPEMVNDSNGILVNPNDEAALEMAIIKLKENLSNYSSNKISSEANAKYSLSAVGKMLDDLYQKTLLNNGK